MKNGHGGEVQLPMSMLSWDCSSVRLWRASAWALFTAAAGTAAATMTDDYQGGGGSM